MKNFALNGVNSPESLKQNAIFQNDRIKTYLDSGNSGGYVCSRFRTKLMDSLVSGTYLKLGASEDSFAQFLCSKQGRRLAETLGEYDEEFMSSVIEYETDRRYSVFTEVNKTELQEAGIYDIEYVESKEKLKKPIENKKADTKFSIFNFTDLN